MNYKEILKEGVVPEPKILRNKWECNVCGCIFTREVPQMMCTAPNCPNNCGRSLLVAINYTKHLGRQEYKDGEWHDC